jgi:phosphoesterase RecJ-like protein
MLSNPGAWADAEGLLRRAQSILAVTHVSPDGDAIGSLMGLTHAMRGLGKTVTPACQDPPHPRFEYLRGVRDIRQSAEGNFDLLVVLDTSDLARLGTIFLPAQHGRLPMVVIDHHITNLNFGTVNVIEPAASSTAEIVLKLLKKMGLPITPDIASALLTGVITDTLGFRTSNTTSNTLAAAMELMQYGASLPEIIRRALVMRSFDSLRLLGAGLSSAKLEGRLAYATLSQKLRRELGVQEERGDGGLVGTLITAYEVDVAAVFVELTSGEIEVGLRAQPGFDVSQVALEFGGGGHAAAAGCTLPGPMRDAVCRVIPRLKRVIRET